MTIKQDILDDTRRIGWTDATAVATLLMDGTADARLMTTAYRFARELLKAMADDGLLQQQGSEYRPIEDATA